MEPLSVTVSEMNVLAPGKRKRHQRTAPKIVHNISFSAPAGKITGLIGPNGSGKSTILKSLYRYLTPHSGKIFFGDLLLTQIPLPQFPYYAGVLAQNKPESVPLCPEEIIGLAGKPTEKILSHLSPHDSHPPDRENLTSLEQLDDLLSYQQHIIDILELRDLMHRPMDSLSGGQQQRVYLALALANDPAIILLDEPDNHLDFSHRIYLIQLLRSLGKTIIIAIHDLSLAAMLCDVIYVLHGGKIVGSGSVAETITPKIIREVFSVEAEIFTEPLTGNLIISAYRTVNTPIC